MREDPIDWGTVAQAVTDLLSGMEGVPYAGRVLSLVRALTGLSQAQDRLLRSIQADTELLRESELKTADILLSEAIRVWPDESRSREFLESARQSLYPAIALCKGDAERAVVEFRLGLVYLALGYSKDAEFWIRRSLTDADRFIEKQMKRVVRDQRFANTRYRDGRKGQLPPGLRIRTLAEGSAVFCGSFIGFGALGISSVIQGQKRLRRGRRDASFIVLEKYLNFRNSCARAVNRFGDVHELFVLREEIREFSPPVFMLRAIDETKFVRSVDRSIERDPNFRYLASPRGMTGFFLKEATKEALPKTSQLIEDMRQDKKRTQQKDPATE